MYWVIQKSIFNSIDYARLTASLERFGIPYLPVSIPNNQFHLEPDVDVDGNVYVCGALKMAKIAQDKGWSPGSFLNENFNFKLWLGKLNANLLNCDIIFGKLSDVETSHLKTFFIRPLEDNKAFDGMVIDNNLLEEWRSDPKKGRLQNLDVIVSPVKNIFREYRIFIVNRKVITGSIYKMGGNPLASASVEPIVIEYAERIVQTWIPSESLVVDIGLTEEGFKVIEFNNINSSGFYASDVSKYVEAIQLNYS